MEVFKSIYNLEHIKTKKDILNELMKEPDVFERICMNIKLSKAKLKDSNPYYSFLGYLNDVTNCAKEIIDINIESDNTSKEQEVLSLSTDDDIKYFISNNIYFIRKQIGGHRSNCKNDNEITIDIYVKKMCDKEILYKKIEEICNKYNVECKVEV